MADLHQQGKVNPISAMTNIIQINGEKVVVNAQEIFTRIAGIINTSSDMAGYLKYELVSQPPSLFDNVSMRKANKASLAKVLASEAKSIEKNYDAYVVDGGHLLHSVTWCVLPHMDRCLQYSEYVIHKYGHHSVVVFDGYVPIWPAT